MAFGQGDNKAKKSSLMVSIRRANSTVQGQPTPPQPGKMGCHPDVDKKGDRKKTNFPLLLNWLVLVLDYGEVLQFLGAAKAKIKQPEKPKIKTTGRVTERRA